jgi:hypothetical protein
LFSAVFAVPPWFNFILPLVLKNGIFVVNGREYGTRRNVAKSPSRYKASDQLFSPDQMWNAMKKNIV